MVTFEHNANQRISINCLNNLLLISPPPPNFLRSVDFQKQTFDYDSKLNCVIACVELLTWSRLH